MRKIKKIVTGFVTSTFAMLIYTIGVFAATKSSDTQTITISGKTAECRLSYTTTSVYASTSSTYTNEYTSKEVKVSVRHIENNRVTYSERTDSKYSNGIPAYVSYNYEEVLGAKGSHKFTVGGRSGTNTTIVGNYK